jgi:hypothetical protein
VHAASRFSSWEDFSTLLASRLQAALQPLGGGPIPLSADPDPEQLMAVL